MSQHVKLVVWTVVLLGVAAGLRVACSTSKEVEMELTPQQLQQMQMHQEMLNRSRNIGVSAPQQSRQQ